MNTQAKLDWDDLRYFLAAAQAKSLAGAARTLGVNHSTIGRRLSSLEAYFGAPLVIRTPDGLQLTQLGLALEPLVEQVEQAVAAACLRATHQKVRVRLAMPTGSAQLFTPHLPRLQREFPELSLELLSETRTVDLGKGEADLALRVGPVLDENLVARKVGEIGSSLYGSDGYLARKPVATDLGDLNGHDFIIDPSPIALAEAQWIEAHRGPAGAVLRIHGLTDLFAAALDGAGLAILPCLLADAQPGLRRLTPQVVIARDLSLVYRREVRLVEPIRAVIRFVLDVLRENTDRISGVVPQCPLTTPRLMD